MAGTTPPNQGKVDYFLGNQTIKPEVIYRHLAICAPYLELVEEFTLLEAIRFHQQFKKFKSEVNIAVFLEKNRASKG